MAHNTPPFLDLDLRGHLFLGFILLAFIYVTELWFPCGSGIVRKGDSESNISEQEEIDGHGEEGGEEQLHPWAISDTIGDASLTKERQA